MSNRKTVFSFKDERDATRARKVLGMRTIKTGKIPCLKCDKVFFSTDCANNRCCTKCNELALRHVSF